MNINNTLQTDVLDILFANRNKSYGAYQLRKNYNRRLSIAVAVMLCVCLLFSVLYKMQAARQATDASLILGPDVTLENTPVKEQPVVPPPQVKPVHIEQQVATIKDMLPRIVTDDQVTTPPPTQADIDGVRIDVVTTAGITDNTIAPPVNEGTGAAKALVKTETFDGEVFMVQQLARFPGGLDAWRKFLERTLRSSTPTENGAAIGSYTVFVSFLVDKQGTISEVKAENDPGYGTAAEAVRVIQRGPAWIPAVQNGHNVIYRQKQAITFVVAEQE